MEPARALRIDLPSWMDAARTRAARGATAEERVGFAIGLARDSVEHGSGGPFGAAVFDLDDGRLLGCGVNLVAAAGCSAAHAEVVALALAQASASGWDLGAGGARRVLASSAAPCAMCLGALPWSGIAALEYGAEESDVAAIGFDEGDKPEAWAERLRARGIAVRGGVLRAEAAEVLRRYARRGGEIYQPRRG